MGKSRKLIRSILIVIFSIILIIGILVAIFLYIIKHPEDLTGKKKNKEL